jgi:hypothetical protein
MRDYHFNLQSAQSDSVPSTLAVPQISVPSTIQINTQLAIPQRRIELVQPDSAKEVARERAYRWTPPPPPKLTFEDSLELNLIHGDSLFTNWDFNTDITALPPSEFMAIGDSVLFSGSTALADSAAVDSLEVAEAPARPTQTTPVQQIPFDGTVEKPTLQQDWFIALLVGVVLVTGLVRMNWYRYLKDVMLTIFFPTFTSKLGSANASNFMPSLILGTLFYINSTLFTFQILTHYRRPIAGFEGALMLPVILVFLFLLFTAKIIAYRIIGKIFDTSSAINRYLSSASATSKAFAVLLLPIIVLFPFSEPVLQEGLIRTGIGMFIALYLIQLTHGIRANFSNLLSGYYIILYLCALEILPLAILYKVLFK